MADSIVNKKSVCIITGATKGLGKAITSNLAKELPKGSLFILLARSQDLLDRISSQVKENDGIESVSMPFDQSCADGETNKKMLQDALAKAGVAVSQYEQAILINNAGTLDHLDYSRNLDRLDVSTEYFKTNLSGCITLTATFLQVFRAPDVKTRVVVNISSLAAISPMKSWLLYCMAKAAREMMMKIVAAEEENTRTLNYAPGPLVTEMTTTASDKTQDPELRKWFTEQIEKKSLVECDDSAQKLIAILRKNTFENALHIDYYDEI
ncbi:sepiapterin reductase [Aplysia californica]|uniref:Sepiapterin reductase n=1 Tax=Aplysia californica TaxID=6500 RepID=A0ABM0JWH7_APLCA|nr:sepiapterin reductase [Aplysia californica]